MRSVQVSWPIGVVAAVVLLLLGAGGAYLWLLRPGDTVPATTAVAAPRSPAPETSGGPLPDVVITLTEEAAAKAGIAVGEVAMSQMNGTLRLAGMVAPNAYREVVVTPLASGRVTRVM